MSTYIESILCASDTEDSLFTDTIFLEVANHLQVHRYTEESQRDGMGRMARYKGGKTVIRGIVHLLILPTGA